MSEMPYPTIIRDVSESLRTLIKSSIDSVEVTFESPAEADQSQDRRIMVYLFQAVEFSPLRNQPPVVGSGMQPDAVPALYMNLKYMIVPYATIEAELILLNQLLSLFRENARLSGAQLQGNLLRAGNEQIGVVPIYPEPDALHRVWELFPSVSYKSSLFYDLRPVRIPLPTKQLPTRVKQTKIDYQEMERVN